MFLTKNNKTEINGRFKKIYSNPLLLDKKKRSVRSIDILYVLKKKKKYFIFSRNVFSEFDDFWN